MKENKRLLPLNESFTGNLKRGLVKTRQVLGLKKYGTALNSLPEKPELPNERISERVSLKEILNDPRPKRIALNEGVFDRFKSILKKEPSLKIENFPARQQKIDIINAKKEKIKKEIMGLDMEYQRILDGKHKAFNNIENPISDTKGKFNSSKLIPKSSKSTNQTINTLNTYA